MTDENIIEEMDYSKAFVVIELTGNHGEVRFDIYRKRMDFVESIEGDYMKDEEWLGVARVIRQKYRDDIPFLLMGPNEELIKELKQDGTNAVGLAKFLEHSETD